MLTTEGRIAAATAELARLEQQAEAERKAAEALEAARRGEQVRDAAVAAHAATLREHADTVTGIRQRLTSADGALTAAVTKALAALQAVWVAAEARNREVAGAQSELRAAGLASMEDTAGGVVRHQTGAASGAFGSASLLLDGTEVYAIHPRTVVEHTLHLAVVARLGEGPDRRRGPVVDLLGSRVQGRR